MRDGVGMLPCQQCILHLSHHALWSESGALHYPWWLLNCTNLCFLLLWSALLARYFLSSCLSLLRSVVLLVCLRSSALFGSYFASCFVEHTWHFAWPAVIAVMHHTLLPVAVVSFVSQVGSRAFELRRFLTTASHDLDVALTDRDMIIIQVIVNTIDNCFRNKTFFKSMS